MALSRQDVPGIAEAIRELRRVISDPPAENWQAPPWLIEQYKRTTLGEAGAREKPSHAGLIHAAAAEVLNRLMPPWHHTRPDCPEITESSLDQRHKLQLIELRDLLSSFALGQKLADNRSEALRALAFLETVVGQFTAEPSAETGAPQLQGPYLARMRDGSSSLLDPRGPGVRYLGGITNTAHSEPVAVGPPELGLELALYQAPGQKLIELSWGGPRTGRVFEGREVTPAEAAAEFLKDGRPVPPGLPLPTEVLCVVQAGHPHDQRSGEELLDRLEISGTPKDSLRHGRELLQRKPDATAAEVIEVMEAAGVAAGTIDKARKLVADLGRPLCLQDMVNRLNNVAALPGAIGGSDYHARYLDAVPEWPLIRYACERLFQLSGPVRSEDVRRLADALRFEAGIEDAGDAPLSEIAPHIQALLEMGRREASGARSASEKANGISAPSEAGLNGGRGGENSPAHDGAQARSDTPPPLEDGNIRTRQELLEYLDSNRELPLGFDRTFPVDAAHWWEHYIWDLYSTMHCLEILWTPAPPYSRLTFREAEDEFQRIRARLRAEIGGPPRGTSGEQHGAGQGEGANGDQDRTQAAALSPFQYDILDTLRCLKATDPEKRTTGREVADKVGGDATEQSVKAPLADLKHRGLVDSKTGRNGGSWLTSEGLQRINLLRPKK